MSKYRYRAIDFQSVDWSGLADRLDQDRVIVPIDVAKHDCVLALMTADREVLVTVKWRHPEQSRALVEQLTALGVGRLEVVMEPSGTYGDPLRELLRAAGAGIYRISPKRVCDAAEVYDGVPSMHDAKAAWVIGRLHLEGVSRPWPALDTTRRTLHAQLAELQMCRDTQRRALNRLEGLLGRHWPEAITLVALDAVSLLKLLARHGDPSCFVAGGEAAVAQVRRDSRGGLKAATVAALYASARTTIGVPCLDAERALIQTLAKEALAARERLRVLERAVVAHQQVDEELAHLRTVSGAVTAAVLRSLLGSVWDYATPGAYLKAGGLNLKERSSGKHRGELRVTKRGPALVRFYLYFAALNLIKRDATVRRWYEAKVARDGGRKGKALMAVTRKLAKALWHVGRGECFDAARLFPSTAHRERQAA